MKKGTLNLIPVVLNRSLLALFMLLGCSTVALATYSTNVTTSTPTYTAGQVNTFNFTVTVTTDGTIEYVDQIRFTFPGTLTVGAATGPEPYLFCGGGQGNKTIAGNVVRWDTPGGPGSFCGAFATGGYNFSVDIDIPAGFSGPLNLTMTTSGDGWPSGSITVIDLPVTINQLLPPEPCVFHCPTNMTFNLAPGECRISVPYTTPYFTGDCLVPIEGPFSLTQNLNTMIVQDALDCTAGTPTSQWRAYNALQGDFTINTVRLGTFFAGTVQVFIYSYTGVVGATTLDLAQMTLLGQSNAAAAPGGQQIYAINLPTPVTVPAGTAFVVEARRTAAGGFAVAGNYGGETGPSYISCPTLGIVAPQTYASVGFGFIHVIQILEGTQLQLLPGVVTQTSGLPSGAEFERGTTENCYELGNPVTGEVLESCCFSITVNEYANPISSLVCNDLVQISLDANCSAVLNADQILEGGPYGCYDDYIVELDKTAPFGNGPWLPAVLGPQDVGKTYQVRVTDPDTGNKCWGNLKVEDKLPPVLVCQNVDVPCNVTGLPGENVAMTADAAFPTFNSATGTTTRTTDVNITTMSQITGLTVTFNTTHTWVGDIDARLTAPNGTTIVLFDRPGFPAGGVFGCDGDGMAVVFNDNAALTAADLENTCNAAVPTISGTYQAVGSLASLVAGGVNGTWTLAVQDFVAGDDGTFNVTLNIQGIGPIAFPNSLQQNVNVFANGQACYTVTAGTGTPVLEPCSAASLCYLDTEVSQNCASGLTKIINRKWTATDASGNTATCIQQIRFLRPTLDDLVLPPNYDDVDEPSLPCSGLSPNQITPGYLEGIGLQGYPYVFGAPDGCNIGWTYEDAVIGVCDGTYKIRRKWTIIDWCSGTDFEHNQIIKVADHAGPTFDCPANITVSTDPFTCCATVDLPDFIASDNCSRIKKITAMVTVIDPQTGQVLNMYNVGGSMSSFPGNNLWEPDTMVNVGSTPCLPIGSHQVMYTLEDDCGNTTVCEFRVIVRDYTPPVAACDEFTVVGIGVDDPFDCYGPAGFLDVPPALDACSFAGVTWVKATTFDDGSYDNCGDVKFTIRRMAPYSDCITGLNPIRGFPDCASPFPTFPSEFERAITEGDSIKFYCCEVGTEQTVVL
ncbi:MAG: proprotein convertase P-domain-containing protein, partial [Saprospiraceae bacterium]|nr:proprotein convertase P-domain-containing protein [Saprospiraceae bacterium]